MIKVSVIIPVYNVKSYLHESLESVINQTYTNLEIILIDDGSDDGSGEICDRFALLDKRIMVIHQRHQGLSSARNAGLKYCTGSAITFLDSDDAFRSEAICKMINIMTSSNTDMVICNCASYNTESSMKNCSKSESSFYKPGIYSKKDIMDMIINGKISCTAWSKMYRTSIWNNLQYPYGHVYEDLYIVLDLLERIDNCYVMNDVLLMHRIRSNSITSTLLLTNLKDHCFAYDYYIKNICEHIPEYFSEKQLKKAMSRKFECVIDMVLNMNWDDPQNHEIIVFVRDEIDSFDINFVINNARMVYKIGYYLFIYCPQLLRIFNPVYHTIRLVWHKSVFRYLFMLMKCLA